MVLKVIRKQAQEWVLIGGVKELWVVKHKANEPKPIPTVGEINFVAKVFDESRPDSDYTELLFRDGDGDWNNIEFNTEAYLCNDDGKTVEKIYG